LVGFNNAEQSGQWRITATPALSDGTFQITARATDNANNVSLPSQPLVLVVDTKSPLSSSTPDLLAASDTGLSNTDNVTTASVRTIVGTAEPGGVVEVFIGTNVVGIVNVDVSGQWKIDESRLGPGTYSFMARVKDRAGNASPFSSALTLTISGKVSPPSAPALLPQSDLGLSSADLITSQTRPTFAGTAEAGATIQLLANNTVIGTGAADAAGRWNVTVANALAEGIYSFTAKSADSAGNISDVSPGLIVTIDTTAPTAPSIPGLIASKDIRTSNIEVISNVSTPTFSGRAETGAMVELLVNGVHFGSGLATGGTWTIPVNQPLNDAAYQISARATDLAGNNSPASPVLSVTVKVPETRLTLSRFQRAFLLSWPSAAEGYSLEAADSLDGNVWLPVDRVPTVEGDARIVIMSGGAASKFFRLKKQ
jgi:large repetitive protein